MAQINFLFLSVGLFYCIVTGIQADDVQSGPGMKESSMFKAFLKSLATMNQDRLDTVKKLAKWQDRNMNAPSVSSGPVYVEDSNDNLLAVVVLNRTAESDPEEMNENPTELDNSDDVVDSATDSPDTQEIMADDDMTNEMDMTDDTNSEIPQDNMNKMKGCVKKSGKRCKKACLSAGKTVCSRYTCEKKLKKALKKECKAACKAAFM